MKNEKVLKFQGEVRKVEDQKMMGMWNKEILHSHFTL